MKANLVFDPPDTPLVTHDQRVILSDLAGKKGARALSEVVNNLDIRTATKSQVDKLIALLSEYPDLEDIKWQKKRRRK